MGPINEKSGISPLTSPAMAVRGVALGPYSSALLGILLKITENEKDTIKAGHGVTASESSSVASVSRAVGVVVL